MVSEGSKTSILGQVWTQKRRGKSLRDGAEKWKKVLTRGREAAWVGFKKGGCFLEKTPLKEK